MRRRDAGAKGSKYLMTAKSNPEVFAICLANGWCSSEGMTYEEAGGVTEISSSIFYGNTDIVSFDELKFFTGLKNGLIGEISTTANGAFQNCTSLESIKLPENLRLIGVRTFSNCTSLKVVKIPSGVTRIYESAFFSTNLVSVEIPSSVTRIDWGAFRNSSNVQYVKIFATVPPTSYTNNFTGGNYYNAPIYVPDESVEAYKAATGWSALASRIKPLSEFVQ